jgi:hypothetical protein
MVRPATTARLSLLPVLIGLLLLLAAALIMKNAALAACVAAAPISLGGILWLRLRSALRRHFARPLEGWIAEAPPAQPAGRAEELAAEWRRLGYEPVGYWTTQANSNPFCALLLHPALPVYACVRTDAAAPSEAIPFLISFFEAGGTLLTTADASSGVLAGVETGAPRLMQLREDGTPAALDGQHLGTVQAWMAGGRQPLPATRDAFGDYVRADHDRLGRALAARGWLPLGPFLRYVAGRPDGVLKF